MANIDDISRVNAFVCEQLDRFGRDLEDALELDSAVKTAGNFREYSKIRGELVREGKL